MPKFPQCGNREAGFKSLAYTPSWLGWREGNMGQRHAKAIDKIVMTSRWELPQFLQKERKTGSPSQNANLP